jgi:NADH dehydrogenase
MVDRMNLLVTGAGGFLGQVMVEAALAAGHAVRAWVRQVPADASPLWHKADIHVSDLTDQAAQLVAVTDVAAIIHCAAVTSAGKTDSALSQKVNIEALKSLYSAAQAAGVNRWIQISSMSAHPGSTSVYGKTKLAGDLFLRAQNPAQPAWTILQPSLIYGPGERGLVAKTLKILKKLPVLPLLGSGRERIRPIYVQDVAAAALTCLQNISTIGKSYQIGGSDEIELRDFMNQMVLGAHLHRLMLPLPLPLAALLAKILARVSANPPISIDNVLGVREAQRVDISAAQRDFAFHPRGVAAGLTLTFASSPENQSLQSPVKPR